MDSSDYCQKLNEIFLDTKEKCFFCLQENVNPTTPTVNLRNICRYLDINSSSILMTHLPKILIGENPTDTFYSQRNNYEFLVKLCASCGSIANKLSELVRQQEIIKMVLDHQLHEFNAVLSSSATRENQRHSSPEPQPPQQKEYYNPDDRIMVEKCTSKLLRTKIVNKCSSKSQKTTRERLPRVQITRITMNQENTPSTPTSTRATESSEFAVVQEASPSAEDVFPLNISVEIGLNINIVSTSNIPTTFVEDYGNNDYADSIIDSTETQHVNQSCTSNIHKKAQKRKISHNNLSNVGFKLRKESQPLLPSEVVMSRDEETAALPQKLTTNATLISSFNGDTLNAAEQDTTASSHNIAAEINQEVAANETGHYVSGHFQEIEIEVVFISPQPVSEITPENFAGLQADSGETGVPSQSAQQFERDICEGNS